MPPSIRLTLHIQPRAARTHVVGMHGDALKIRLAAPPVENAANEALIAFVAERLDLPRRNIRIVSGHTSRRKIVEVEGAPSDAMACLLAGR